MTALGPVRLERSFTSCPACGGAGFAADGLLGLGGRLTPRALRMACLAGLNDPFRRAARLLGELAGWSVSEDTLRRRCHEHAARASGQRGGRAALPGAFAAAGGDWELHVDAGKVNTVEGGWRDVKAAAFARRERGEASSSLDHEQRGLPAPGARAVVAAVEPAEAFGRRVEREALRLGAPLGAGLSVLGDGAGWIWGLADDHFHGAEQVLDVYHAAERLAAAGRAALGEGEAMAGWLDGARRLLVGDGYAGACEALARPLPDEEARARLDAASGEALGYFAAHRGRLGYAARLARGQAIGSGLVEGAIKQLVNLRLKRTGARWRTRHVGPLVEMLAMADSAEWGEYWASLAA
jgi:hypothetical protein